MFINFEVLSLHMSDAFELEEGKTSRRLCVSMDVGYADEDGSINLDTGETLFRPFGGAVRSSDTLKPIKCDMQVLPSSGDDLKKAMYNISRVQKPPVTAISVRRIVSFP